MHRLSALGDRPQGIVFVVSGPSGVGKGTVLKAALQRISGVEISVSATTRAPRSREKHGREYYFMSQDEFTQAVEQGAFLEWAEYHRARYGTLRCEVKRIQEAGSDVALEIDVQGARQVRERLPESVLITVIPPAFEDLRTRLESRGTETPDEIQERLELARGEMQELELFDYLVVNDCAETAADELTAIIRSERCRTHRANIQDMLRRLA